MQRSDPRAACARRVAVRGDARAGFSLIEALIVLIVAGMALTLILSVGGKANETDFRLGRRALMTADSRLGTDSLRAIIAGIALAPAGWAAEAGPDTSRAGFIGEARGFRADALLDVATPCAAAGPVDGLQVELVQTDRGALLACHVGEGARTTLLDLGARRVSFSYSLDGQVWTDRWAEPEAAAQIGTATPHERRLFVRLASEDGSVEITGRASSDRPDLQPVRQQIAPAL
ncbi:MAG: hypothetical protein WDM92_05685 [Caulobacteraceae bacterium]